MVLSINGIVLGEYAERNWDFSLSVAKPAGLNKTARFKSYTTGILSEEPLTISFATSDVGAAAAVMRNLTKNGDGVYYLYDDSNHIYDSSHGVWVNIENVSCTTVHQDHANSLDRGEIMLKCNVAVDGTGSLYTVIDSTAVFGRCTTYTVPSPMTLNTSYDISITFQNTGTDAWRNDDMITLITWHDDTFSESRVNIGQIITPGNSYTWNFVITPDVAGVHIFKFDLCLSNGTKFGEGKDIVVTVA